MTRDSLEQELLADSKFQHILKFAPQSQRELMTFELANYFHRYTAEKVLEARIIELKRVCDIPYFGGETRSVVEGKSLHLQAELSKLKEEE